MFFVSDVVVETMILVSIGARDRVFVVLTQMVLTE